MLSGKTESKAKKSAGALKKEVSSLFVEWNHWEGGRRLVLSSCLGLSRPPCLCFCRCALTSRVNRLRLVSHLRACGVTESVDCNPEKSLQISNQRSKACQGNDLSVLSFGNFEITLFAAKDTRAYVCMRFTNASGFATAR